MLFGKYPGGVIAVLGSRGEGGRDAWTDRDFVPGGLFEVLRRLSGTGLHSRYTQRHGLIYWRFRPHPGHDSIGANHMHFC